MRNTRSIHLKIEDIPEEPIRLYFRHLQARKCAPPTFRNKLPALRQFAAHVAAQGKTLRDVTRRDLDQYHLRLKRSRLAVTTVFQAMAAIRSLFHYLEQAQYVFIDPAADLLLRVPPKPLPYVPNEEDIRRLLAYPKTTVRAGLRDRAFMEALYSTGARLEEMASVTLFDLNLERGLVKLYGKGRKERFAPLGRKACDWLRQYLQLRADLLRGEPDEEALWLNNRGTRLSYQGAEKIVLRNAQGAGLRPFSSHTLRRACATHMLRHGAHPVQLQELLGHASMQHLSRYLRITIPELTTMHRHSKPGR